MTLFCNHRNQLDYNGSRGTKRYVILLELTFEFDIVLPYLLDITWYLSDANGPHFKILKPMFCCADRACLSNEGNDYHACTYTVIIVCNIHFSSFGVFTMYTVVLFYL